MASWAADKAKEGLEMTDEPNTKPNTGEANDWTQAHRDTYRRLRERSEQADYPPAWTPTEPGDELMGVLVAVTEAAPTKFGPAPVVTIKRFPDGKRSVCGCCTPF